MEAHHVHLPELHRTRPLPAPVHGALATPGEGLDELVAVQHAVDAGASWNPGHALAAQLVDQAPRPPARMVTAQVTHHALHLRRDLVRTPRRSPGAVDQSRHPRLAVPPQPRVHGLPADSMSHRHLGDGQAILEHLQDDPVALFHHVQLHKHEPGPSDGAQSLRTSGPEGGRLCQASGGRAAHRQASLGPAVSSICRTSTKDRRVENVSAMYALTATIYCYEERDPGPTVGIDAFAGKVIIPGLSAIPRGVHAPTWLRNLFRRTRPARPSGRQDSNLRPLVPQISPHFSTTAEFDLECFRREVVGMTTRARVLESVGIASTSADTSSSPPLIEIGGDIGNFGKNLPVHRPVCRYRGQRGVRRRALAPAAHTRCRSDEFGLPCWSRPILLNLAKLWLSRAIAAYCSTTPSSSTRTSTSAGRRLPLNRISTGSPVRRLRPQANGVPIEDPLLAGVCDRDSVVPARLASDDIHGDQAVAHDPA